MLTDYMLAAENVVFSMALFDRACRAQQHSAGLWAAAFLVTAVAAVAGGTSHGLKPHLAEASQNVWWKVTVHSLGLASLFLLSGAIVASVSGALRKLLLAAAAAKFVVYAAWMKSHNEFRYVIYDYAPAMVGVLVLQAGTALPHGDHGARWTLAGVLVSFAAAAIQQSKLTLHKHLNHNDLYHLIQMGASYAFYRAGRLLKDR